MFDSVLLKSLPRRRIGTGTLLSIGVHVALVAVIAVLTTRHEPTPPVVAGPIVFQRPAARPAAKLGSPAPAAAAPERPTPPRARRPTAIIQPKDIPTTQPPAAPEPATEPAAAGPEDVGVPNGQPDGDPTVTTPGGAPNGPGPGTEEQPPGDFKAGMTRPQVPSAAFSGLYTREALEAHVEGMMIVRCQVFADGSLRHCRALKALPHLEEPVLRRLQTVRATPATLNGQPVSVDYVFNFRFSMPR